MRHLLGGIKGEVSPVEYLMLWIGLVGCAVGLSLPKEIVSETENLNRLQIHETTNQQLLP